MLNKDAKGDGYHRVQVAFVGFELGDQCWQFIIHILNFYLEILNIMTGLHAKCKQGILGLIIWINNLCQSLFLQMLDPVIITRQITPYKNLNTIID